MVLPARRVAPRLTGAESGNAGSVASEIGERAAGYANLRCFDLDTLILFGVAVAVSNAQAHAGSGTASYVFQIAAAGTVAVLFTLKRRWARVSAAAVRCVPPSDTRAPE